MITWLTFLICTAAGSCHVTMPAERPFMGMSACFREGVMLMPSWQEAHPSWHVSKIRCTPGNRPAVEDEA